MNSQDEDSRPLTDQERALAHWMLDNGGPEAKAFLSQLDHAKVTSWKCPCGCASINFHIEGCQAAPPGVHVLADFIFGDNDDVSGIFIFERGGILSGLEVYGLAGDAPKVLPKPEILRTLKNQTLS